MYKSKLKRKKLWFDITPMCDIAIVMLIFSAFTWVPDPMQPLKIVEPTITVPPIYGSPPDNNTGIILMANGKVMFDMPDKIISAGALLQMGRQYGITFSYAELSKFEKMGVVGVPIAQLKQYIHGFYNKRAFLNEPGVPDDSPNNELADRIYCAREAAWALAGRDLQIAIDADKSTPYPEIEKIISILEKQHMFKLKLFAKGNFKDNTYPLVLPQHPDHSGGTHL